MRLRELCVWSYIVLCGFFSGGAAVEALTPAPRSYTVSVVYIPAPDPSVQGIALHTTWGEDQWGNPYDLPEIGVSLDGKVAGGTDQFGFLLIPTAPGAHWIDTWGKWIKDLEKRAHVTADVKAGYWSEVEIHFMPE